MIRRPPTAFHRYAVAIVLVGVSLAFMLLLDPFIGMNSTPYLLFFGALTISAWYGGRGAGILATLLSALLSEYFFIQPEHQFGLGLHFNDSLRTTLFILQGLLISHLCGALRLAQDRTRTALEQLQANETRFRRLVDSNIIGVVGCDLKGAITSANDEFLRMTGFSRADVLAGRVRWDEMTPADLKPLDEPAMAELLSKGKNTAYEKAFISKDGRRVPVVVGAALLRNDPESVISFVLDLTRLWLTEQRLTVQYAVTRVLAEAVTVRESVAPILQALCQSLDWEFAIIWSVDQQAGVLRYLESWPMDTLLDEFRSLKQPITFTPGMGLPGRIWASGQPAWIECLATDPNFPRAAAAQRAGLESAMGFPIRLDKQVLGVIEGFSPHGRPPDKDLLQLMGAIGSQIGQFMERKRAEESLRQSQALFDRFMSHTPVAAWIVDQASRIVYLNPTYFRLFNFPSQDAIGKTVVELYPPQFAEQFLQSNGPVFTHQEVVETIETAPRTDGSTGEFLVYKFPIPQEPDELLLGGVALDITERKQAEAERERLLQREQEAREQAESANRIKDEFLAVLSHELRSPLNPILGWAKLLQTRPFAPEKAQQALQTIERNAKLQTQLIEDLLDVSRILRGKMVLNVCPVDLVTVIEAALETVQLSAEAKGIPIAKYLANDIGFISGDAGRLQQIVWNLLSNAIKFSPPGHRVDIRLERVGAEAQIQVRDTGKGINPSFLPHVFEYFRQEDGRTTRKFGGLGLGLAIVRYLTELHGGSVQAESGGEGQGATFTVRLPLLKVGHSSEERSVSPPPPTSRLKGVRILAVDDEADMRDLLVTMLEDAGAVVKITASAVEALAALDSFHPDLLISDIGMAEMDGYMLLHQIRRLPPEQGGQISALALTAYARDEDRQQVLAAGFQQHLPKPIEPDTLVAAVADLIRQSPTG